MKKTVSPFLVAVYTLFLAWLIVWAINGIWLLVTANYLVRRDTTAWLNRAQVAAAPEDMERYLDKTLEGMKKWKLGSGHAAFVFKTPDNEMSLITRALTKAADRAGELKQVAQTKVEYHVGLDDLRGTIRELDLHAEYRYCINHPIWFWFSALFGWLGPGIFGLYKLIEY